MGSSHNRALYKFRITLLYFTFTVRLQVSIRFGSEICQLCVGDLEIVQHILQNVQIDKLHRTLFFKPSFFAMEAFF